MAGSKSRPSTQEGKSVRAWGETIIIAAMVLALVALPVGFMMQLPLVLALSIAGIVVGSIALTC